MANSASDLRFTLALSGSWFFDVLWFVKLCLSFESPSLAALADGDLARRTHAAGCNCREGPAGIVPYLHVHDMTCVASVFDVQPSEVSETLLMCLIASFLDVWWCWWWLGLVFGNLTSQKHIGLVLVLPRLILKDAAQRRVIWHCSESKIVPW